MKIVITGAEGQLGQLVEKEFNEENEVYGLNSKQLNITDKDSVQRVMSEIKPNVIVNCAAYNNVDNAELCPDVAKNVNEIGPKNIAEVSRDLGTVVVHISTDYVFDGNAQIPYHEGSQTNPINIYGQTKLNGEHHVQQICENHIILRTAWLYGSSKKNFFNSIVEAARRQDEISVVDDQVGNPTYLPDLVSHINILLKEQLFGLFHCSGNGYCSRYDFAKRILGLMGTQTKIRPVLTQDYPHMAKRPSFSALENKALETYLNVKMPNWEESLLKYVNETKLY